ncbi:LacI family DNA-binding transcriptional regulator [bacterium]|nr:LacI family DNA-binding transcriptional regulator [bacterium]
MATIQDVARRAGVGVGTVSRVINNSPLVSDTTRARVQAVIDEIGYRPSTVARALSLGHSSIITVVAPFLTDPSVVLRLRGVASVVRESEYDLVLYDVEAPEQHAARLDDAIYGGRSAAVIVMSLAASGAIAQKRESSKVPLVWVDRRIDGVPCLTIDDHEGGRLAARHLLELGHRHIGFIGDRPDERFGFTSGDDRFAGFCEEIAASGLAVPGGYVRRVAHGMEDAATAMGELLALPDPPTAIFATSDLIAYGAIEAARARGVRVPGDLSVVGFDDIAMSAHIGLTTVRQPLFESGSRSAELALAMLAGDDVDTTAEWDLPLELVERSTTGPHR